jgi:hypothetical protein
MILKRMARNIRKQDWFVVFIEIMIVVIGILIGLQIDDWNQSRLDRIQESSYLKRLSVDLEADIKEFNRRIESDNRRTEQGKFLMATVNNLPLVKKKPTEFMYAIVYAGFTSSPIISDHTFEEIKSSGNLAILSDVGLRTNLIRYYTAIESFTQWTFIIEQKQKQYTLRSAGILNYEQASYFTSYKNDREFSIEEATIAYNNMMKRPEFLEWLPDGTNHERGSFFYQEWSEMAGILLIQLDDVSHKL